MLSYIWPIGLVILSNTVYQLCAKSVPDTINPFASLTVTYLVAAGFSAVLFFTMNDGDSLIKEYSHLNWAPFVLGISIVGLEVGYIFAYKAGWPVSSATLVQSSIVAIALLVIGCLLYREALSPSKIAGMLICLVGLYFINK